MGLRILLLAALVGLLTAFIPADDPDVPPPGFQPWAIIVAPQCLGGAQVEIQSESSRRDWTPVTSLPNLEDGDCLTVGAFKYMRLIRVCCHDLTRWKPEERKRCSQPPARWRYVRGKRCRRVILPDGTEHPDHWRFPTILFPMVVGEGRP